MTTATAPAKRQADKSIHERIKDASDFLIVKENDFKRFAHGLEVLIRTGKAPAEIEIALHLAKQNHELLAYLLLEAERKSRPPR